MRRAFQDLVAEGVVYRVPGRGTYADESAPRYLRQLGSIEDLMSLSEDTTMEVLSGLRRRVDVDAASRLRLDDDVVYTVVFRRLHDGVPFVLTRVHLIEAVALPVLHVPELADGAVSAYTIIGLLEPHLAEPIAEAAQSITVAAADDAGRRGGRLRARSSDAAGGPAVLRLFRTRPSNWRSASSCPSSTPTGSRCAAPPSGISARLPSLSARERAEITRW